MAFRNSLKPVSFLFLSFFTIANLNCTHPAAKAELDKMEWLTGTWENENNGIKTVETWKRISEKSYAVTGFMIEGKDTIFAESITVKPGSGGMLYTVTISGQNNGKPVVFKLKENSGIKTVFTNPEHDFPQTISYSRKSTDSVLVELAGILKGKPANENYMLHRK